MDKAEKVRLNAHYNCEGGSRSGKNGATLNLAAVRRNKKRSVKAKAARQLRKDEGK